MPESRVRKAAAVKKQHKQYHEAKKERAEKERLTPISDRSWVPWVFVTLGLLGVFWLVVFYIAGNQIPFMAAIGQWNILIGMVLMGSSFCVATLWK